ncbi:hypothetical protein ES703_111421 [subsurface metagenome]
MKVLIADKFPDEGIEAIKNLKCDVEYNQALKEQTLLEVLTKEEYEILIVRSTIVTAICSTQ